MKYAWLYSLLLYPWSGEARGAIAEEVKAPQWGSHLPKEHQDAAFKCPTEPAPVIDLTGVYFYSDKAGSVINPDQFAAAKDSENEIRSFTRLLDSEAALILRSAGDTDVSACVLKQMTHWARSNALLGTLDDNAKNYRVWALVPIAQSFDLLRRNGVADTEAMQEVKTWIAHLAQANKEYARTNLHNNLAYWASAGFALSAIATQDRSLLQDAVALAKAGINTITVDGYFPGELARGARALEYHGFALDPLAITSEIAFANKVDLFKENKGAMLRVALNLIASEKDTSKFSARAGVKQSAQLPLSIGNYGWSEIFLLHYDDAALRNFVASHRPINFDRMGGDMTLLYGN